MRQTGEVQRQTQQVQAQGSAVCQAPRPQPLPAPMPAARTPAARRCAVRRGLLVQDLSRTLLAWQSRWVLTLQRQQGGRRVGPLRRLLAPQQLPQAGGAVTGWVDACGGVWSWLQPCMRSDLRGAANWHPTAEWALFLFQRLCSAKHAKCNCISASLGTACRMSALLPPSHPNTDTTLPRLDLKTAASLATPCCERPVFYGRWRCRDVAATTMSLPLPASAAFRLQWRPRARAAVGLLPLQYFDGLSAPSTAILTRLSMSKGPAAPATCSVPCAVHCHLTPATAGGRGLRHQDHAMF